MVKRAAGNGGPFQWALEEIISEAQPRKRKEAYGEAGLTALCGGKPLLTADCSLPTAHCRLLTADCSLPAAHCPLIYCATMTQLDLPNGGKLDLRPVTDDDDLFLLALYGSTRADELNQVVWAEGQREAFLRWQFDMQKREYEARFPDARHELITIDYEPAGRIWIGEDKEQIRLLDISLLPQFQKRGAGTILLKELMQEAARAGKFLRHMVFVLNNDAHRFYERLGFVVIEDVGAYKHMEYGGKVKSDEVMSDE